MSYCIPNWCKVGYFIDAKDSMNDWCVAYVTEINEVNKTITVFYDGWDVQNTTYPVRSSKIAPFRKNTVKYTGPRRGAHRKWELTEKELNEYQDQVSSLLISNITASDPFYITQFFRGKLYIYIENLLMCDYRINKRILPSVVNFFGSVIKLIVLWLKKAPELFPFYYKSLSNPDLYLEDSNTALALVWHELMDTLNKLFALDPRVSNFFQTYDSVPEDYEPSPLSLMTDKKYSETLMYMINLFTKEKGFEAVITIINEKDEQKRVPFPFIATNLLYVLGQFFDRDFWQKFNQDLTSAVLQRIDIISEAELKDLKHEDIIRVLSMIKDNKENLDLKKLNFYLRMLKSNYFEKRIKGLSEINSVLESFDKKIEAGKGKFSKEEVRDWVVKNNLLDLVINDRPHVELAKRSSVVVRFLASCKMLEASHLENLWASMQGKHDSYVRATHSAILDFTTYLGEDLHDFLYMKIKSVPLESYDEGFLNLIKEFTQIALNIAIRTSLHNRVEMTKEFGLEILEKLMLDSCPVDFVKQACKHIGVILTNPLASKLRSSLMNKLIQLVMKNDSVPQSLSLIIKLLKGIKDPKRLLAEIKSLNESQKVLEIALNNLLVYTRLEKPEDPWEKTISGRSSHQQNLVTRLRFIEFILNKSASFLKMTQNHLEELWKTLGQSAVVPEQSLFFTWITRGVKVKPPLDAENVDFLFQGTLMNDESFQATTMSQASFEYFKYIFVLFHYNHNNIETFSEKFKYRKSKTLIGFDKLLFIQLHSSEASQEAGKFIISLLLKYSSSVFASAGSILEDFFDSLLSILLANKNNDAMVTRGLTLIKQLLLSDSECESFTPNSYVYVQEGMTREFMKVYYDQSLNVRHLRREIAKQYKKPIESVHITFSDKRLSSIDDDIKLKSYKFHCINVEFKTSDFKEYSPLPALSQNQKVIKSLFELLSSADKSYLTDAWNLLIALPINQYLERSFQTFEQPLAKLLDQTNIYKLLYELIIIRKLAQDDKGWKQRFLKNNGLEVLIEIFEDSSSTPLRQESLIRTFSVLVTKSINIEKLESFIRTFFKALADISKISQDIKDLDSFTESTEFILDFLQHPSPQILISYFSSSPSDLQDLFNSVLFSPSSQFNKRIREQLESLSTHSQVSSIFFSILFGQLGRAVELSNENYWKLFTYIMKNTSFLEKESERKVIVSELTEFIKTASCEKNSNNKNEVLAGCLTLLSVSWRPDIKVASTHNDLFLTKCLFEIPDFIEKNSLVPPICKHLETRSNAFELVLQLCRLDRNFLDLLVKDLDKYHEEADWRGCRKTDWSISAVSKEKSQSGLVGLKNLGCTCYMNSMLQQIFMIQSFRKGILTAKALPQDDSMLYQLQYLFSSLQYSDRQYINPKSFASTIKDYEGNPINVNEQMDVDEFFNYFMDKLETWLKSTSQNNLIKNHFGGLQVTELIGKDCPHRSERYEPFLTVSVEVKNKKSLQEGLESFVSGEMLEGENAYQCDHCEAKVRAIRRVCLKHLPNYLIIALRRFEFDFETMNRVKLNDFCEFPLEIDLEPYTQEGLDRLEKGVNKEQVPKKFSDDYYNYKLRGIVIHAGTAESGHYYSYIQDQLKKWFEFNDVWVKEFDVNDIPEECFGGAEKFIWSSAISNISNLASREKCGNAYLLFYERTGIYAVRSGDEEMIEKISLEVEGSQEIEPMAMIREENKTYWRNKLIFAAEYSRFISGLSTIEDMPFKFVFKFFLTIMIRTKEKREELINVYVSLENQLEGSKEFCEWVLEVISVDGVCKELLLYCPIHMMRKIIVGLIRTAFKYASKAISVEVTKRLLKLLPLSSKEYSKNYSQYHEVLKYSILASEPEVLDFKILNIIIKFLLHKPFKVPISSDPINKDIYLGYEAYEHPVIEKPELMFSESKSTTLGYLFQLLYTLHEKIPKKYKDLLRNPEVLEDFLRQADNKVMFKYLGKLYSELSSPDPQHYQQLIRKVIEFSHSQEFQRKSQYNKILTPILLKSCPNSAEIARFFLSWKVKQLRASKLFSDIETNILYLFNICSKSREFQSIFKDYSDITAFIDKWIRERLSSNSKIPSFEDPRSSLRALYSKLQKILKNEDFPVWWDSDDEIEEEKLQKGKMVEVFDSQSQQWLRGTIRQRLGDLLYIQMRGADNSEYFTLREVYDDIAPLGARTKSYT